MLQPFNVSLSEKMGQEKQPNSRKTTSTVSRKVTQVRNVQGTVQKCGDELFRLVQSVVHHEASPDQVSSIEPASCVVDRLAHEVHDRRIERTVSRWDSVAFERRHSVHRARRQLVATQLVYRLDLDKDQGSAILICCCGNAT